MDTDASTFLRQLLLDEPVAALGTLHRGEPAVSMVPFVLDAAAAEFVIHVSALATHTADMRAHARVGLMVMAPPGAEVPPQARPRVSLQADARALPADSEAYGRARELYLARFPDAAVTFGLGDFSIVVLRPVSARLVAGFGRAYALAGERLVVWLRGGAR